MSSLERVYFAESRPGPTKRLVSSISGGGTYPSHGNKLSGNEGFSGEETKAFDSAVAQVERSLGCFSLDEIKMATHNFDDALIIGVGGFGKVYQGFINNGATVVAVKRLKAESQQGAREFSLLQKP